MGKCAYYTYYDPIAHLPTAGGRRRGGGGRAPAKPSAVGRNLTVLGPLSDRGRRELSAQGVYEPLGRREHAGGDRRARGASGAARGGRGSAMSGRRGSAMSGREGQRHVRAGGAASCRARDVMAPSLGGSARGTRRGVVGGVMYTYTAGIADRRLGQHSPGDPPRGARYRRSGRRTRRRRRSTRRRWRAASRGGGRAESVRAPSQGRTCGA
jgi:hypothetical protein